MCIRDSPYPSLALVAKFESWMDGTVVTLDEDDNIKQFIPGSKMCIRDSSGNGLPAMPLPGHGSIPSLSRPS